MVKQSSRRYGDASNVEPLVLHKTADARGVAARRTSERGNLRDLGGLRGRRGAGRVDEAEAVGHGDVPGAAAAVDELDEDGDVPPRVLVVAVRVEHDGPAVAGRVERRRLGGPARTGRPWN